MTDTQLVIIKKIRNRQRWATFVTDLSNAFSGELATLLAQWDNTTQEVPLEDMTLEEVTEVHADLQKSLARNYAEYSEIKQEMLEVHEVYKEKLAEQ